MKTSRTTPADLASSRRAQPARQTRQNPTRTSASLLRSFGGRDALAGSLGNMPLQRDNVEIFPAITHFADAITALPKELVRHFTLLKEVDAKIFAPEEALQQLVDAVLNSAPPPRRPQIETEQSIAGASSSTSAVESIFSGNNTNGQSGSNATADISNQEAADHAYDPENLPRRQLFRQCTYTMTDMLVSLDEKNHVISTATEALNKQLRRIDEIFPYIEREISDEARNGSTTHWAYSENRVAKPAERPRREAPAVAQISREAQLHADEAAARSDARKQAMLAKRGKVAQAESDFDDNRIDARKSHGNTKKTRPAEAISTVGLGITTGTNGAPTAKRRKVEKPNGAPAMERSISGVFPGNGVSKGAAASPREASLPDPVRKKTKASTIPNGQPRKRTAASNAMSPSIASSPIHSTFPEAKALGRGSPAPPNGRPGTGRARQNSTQSTIESARQRPTSSASNKLNGNGVSTPDLAPIATTTGRSISEVKTSMKESAVNVKGEHMIEEADQRTPEVRGGLVVGSRRDSTLKKEESEANGETTPILPQASVAAVTTKSGRASKPSTPAIPSFPDPVRSRSSRATVEATAGKRSHKKGAGQAAQLLAAQTADQDAADSVQGDGEDEDLDVDDADEPRYCYCNGVSYGVMVACDHEGCVKDWFHLDCVGLKTAPIGKAKWYCDDCKEIMKSSKRFNGR